MMSRSGKMSKSFNMMTRVEALPLSLTKRIEHLIEETALRGRHAGRHDERKRKARHGEEKQVEPGAAQNPHEVSDRHAGEQDQRHDERCPPAEGDHGDELQSDGERPQQGRDVATAADAQSQNISARHRGIGQRMSEQSRGTPDDFDGSHSLRLRGSAGSR